MVKTKELMGKNLWGYDSIDLIKLIRSPTMTESRQDHHAECCRGNGDWKPHFLVS